MKNEYFLKNLLTVVCAFFLSINTLRADPLPKTDSLKLELKKAKEDTHKVELLNKLCSEVIYNHPEEAAKYYMAALQLSRKLGYKKGEAGAIARIGLYNEIKGRYDTAFIYHKKSLDLYKSAGFKQGMCLQYLSMGRCVEDQGMLMLASEYYIEALKIAESMNDKQRVFSAMLNLGIVYKNLGNQKKSFEYVGRCLKLAREIKDSLWIAYAIDGYCTRYIELENHSKALEYCLTAAELYNKFGPKTVQASIKIKIAHSYIGTGQYSKSLPIIREAIKENEELNRNFMVAYAYEVLGKYYQKAGEHNKAIEVFNKAFLIAKEINHRLRILYSSELLSSSYEHLGNYKKALEYYKFYKQIDDSLKSEKNFNRLSDLETKYGFDKKEKEIALLSQKNMIQELQLSQNNTFLYALGGSGGLLIVITFLLYKQNQLKNEKKQGELEQKALRSQMNPHFTFNALTSIQKYILENDATSATHYLSKFSKLMRQVLENSREDLISLADEMKTLENYLAVEQLMQKEKFDYSIIIDESIDPDEIAIPPMLIQPFVENSIKHGFVKMTKKGIIKIKFELKNKSLYCEITDNGIGRKKSSEIRQKMYPDKKSLGMEIIKERTKLFNKKNKNQINISADEILNNDNEVIGTKVSIIIPLFSKVVSGWQIDQSILNN